MQLRTLRFLPLLLLFLAPLARAGTAPIPAAPALQSAANLVDDVYKDDLAAAKTPSQKLALAQKMLDAARDEKDPATLFTVLTKTLNLACEAADLQSAFNVIDRLDADFNIDALKLRADSTTLVSKAAVTPEQCKALIPLAATVVDSALDADRYDIANAAGLAIAEAARKSKDVRLQTDAANRLQHLRAAETAYNDNKAALQILAAKPGDPDANLKVGNFRCLVKGDWENGLPLLALSSDETLQTLAKTELAGVGGTDEQVKLADGWWDLADKNTQPAKSQLQAHAAQWYRAAMPSLAGLGKMEIEKRLASAQFATDVRGQAGALRTIDLMALVDPAKDAVAGKWTLKDGVLSAGVTPQGRLQIPYHPPAEYDMHVEFTRESGSDIVAVFLVGGGNQFYWFMGGWHNSVCGFETIGDLAGDANRAAVHMTTAVVNGQRYDIVLKVRNSGVTAFVGGKLMSSYKTDYSDAHVHPAWPLKDALALGLGASISATRFFKIEVTEISGQGEFTRQTANKSPNGSLVASTTPPAVPGLQPAAAPKARRSANKGPDSPLDPGPTTSQPPNPASENDLQILDAKWGAENRQTDVTAKLRSQVKDGALRCSLTNTLLGDPAPSVPKTLVLVYQARGEKITVRLHEGDEIDISSAPAIPFNPAAIDRPEFANTPKPIQKNITSITSMMVRVADDGDTLGLTTDIIAAVAPDTRRSRDGGAGFNRSKVGEQMNTSFDEALRAVHLRYPTWEGRIDFSFGEKYTEHDGGSAGTAFGLPLLSSLEGFDLDPKCAVTGDITVDWKVRRVAGVASKIRGAILDKCLYAAIPASNEEVINDLPLLYGESSLWDIQTLSIATLQEAAATLRTDRSPQLAEALKLFADLQPALTKNSRLALRDPATLATLKHILELAPNHLSAKALLALANNASPKTLSSSASLYRFSIILYPYRNFIGGRQPIDRNSLPASVTASARKQVEQLRRIASREFQPLITDLAALIETAEETAARKSRNNDFDKNRDALLSRLTTVSANKDLLEKLVREGY